jgi:diguanylate cyclase (GGDEF)-like protein
MLDLDHFKEINDVHGHLAGDAVLARTGTLLREALRASDHKNRYGGEEFLLVLPDTTAENARTVAEMLRGAIARAAVAHADRVLRVTASFGVTTAAPGEIDAEAIVARADAALYDAKHAGRDCVRAVPAPTPEAVDLSRLRLENAVRETPAA